MIASATSLILMATDRNPFGRTPYQLRTGSARGAEGVRFDDEVLDARVVGQRDRDGWRLTAGEASSVKDLVDGGEMGRSVRERFADGGLELSRAVLVEQPEQAGGSAPEA